MIYLKIRDLVKFTDGRVIGTQNIFSIRKIFPNGNLAIFVVQLNRNIKVNKDEVYFFNRVIG